MRSSAIAAGALAAALTLPAGAAARKHHPPKPSIRVTGISVNQQNFRPGTHVTRKSPVNACYYIGGPSQSPQNVQAFVFVHAVGIPKHAPLSFDLVTPWDHQQLPDSRTKKPTFGNSFFLNKGHAGAIFGGATGPHDFYRYDDEGTASNIFNGSYSVRVAVKVKGRWLRSRGAITIACE